MPLLESPENVSMRSVENQAEDATTNFAESLKDTLKDKDEEARYAYAETFTNAHIAAQLKGLREKEDWSQEELAQKLGTKQSGVSRLENANYAAWKVETLRKIARVFGVRLRISFEEFGDLIPEMKRLRDRMVPRRFEEDPVFSASVAHREHIADTLAVADPRKDQIVLGGQRGASMVTLENVDVSPTGEQTYRSVAPRKPATSENSFSIAATDGVNNYQLMAGD